MRNTYIDNSSGEKQFILNPLSPYGYTQLRVNVDTIWADVQEYYQKKYNKSIVFSEALNSIPKLYTGKGYNPTLISGILEKYVVCILSIKLYPQYTSIYAPSGYYDQLLVFDTATGKITIQKFLNSFYYTSSYMYSSSDTLYSISSHYKDSTDNYLLWFQDTTLKQTSLNSLSNNSVFNPALNTPLCENDTYIFVAFDTKILVLRKKDRSFVSLIDKIYYNGEGYYMDSNSQYLYMTVMGSSTKIVRYNIFSMTIPGFEPYADEIDVSHLEYYTSTTLISCDEDRVYIGAKYYTTNIRRWNGPDNLQVPSYSVNLDLEYNNEKYILSPGGGSYSDASSDTKNVILNENSSTYHNMPERFRIKSVKNLEDNILYIEEEKKYISDDIIIYQSADKIIFESIGFSGLFSLEIEFYHEDENIKVDGSLTFELQVIDVNDAPYLISILKDNDEILVDDLNNITIEEGGSCKLTINALDEENDYITYYLISDNTSIVTVTKDDSNVYTINGVEDKYGIVSMTIKIRDSKYLMSEYDFIVKILEKNDPPVVFDLDIVVDENTKYNATSIYKDLSFIDVDDTIVEFVVVEDVSIGTLEFNKNGYFTYMPELNWNSGDDLTNKVTFKYIARDRIDEDISKDSNVGTVTITVKPINTKPLLIDYPTNFEVPQSSISNIQVNVNDVETDINNIKFNITGTNIKSGSHIGDGIIELDVGELSGEYTLVMTVEDEGGLKDTIIIPFYVDYNWSNMIHPIMNTENEFIMTAPMTTYNIWKINEKTKIDLLNKKYTKSYIKSFTECLSFHITDFIYGGKPILNISRKVIDDEISINDFVDDNFYMAANHFKHNIRFITEHVFTESQKNKIRDILHLPKKINTDLIKFNNIEMYRLKDIVYEIDGVDITYINTSNNIDVLPLYDSDSSIIGYKKNDTLYLDRFQ